MLKFISKSIAEVAVWILLFPVKFLSLMYTGVITVYALLSKAFTATECAKATKKEFMELLDAELDAIKAGKVLWFKGNES